MKPILSGGSVRAPIDLIHSMPFGSAQSGVPSPPTMQVNPLVPALKPCSWKTVAAS